MNTTDTALVNFVTRLPIARKNPSEILVREEFFGIEDVGSLRKGFGVKPMEDDNEI